VIYCSSNYCCVEVIVDTDSPLPPASGLIKTNNKNSGLLPFKRSWFALFLSLFVSFWFLLPDQFWTALPWS